MDVLQIIVLILGAVLFTVSFFIPDKQVNTKEIKEKEERIFKELVEQELPDIRKMIEDATQDGIEHAKETTKRQMERLTNEKMMAINEYSDTVMSEIHKNHEEAVFLYDMLNNKHAQVKNTAAELNQVMKQSKQAQNTAKANKVNDEKEAKEEKSALLSPEFEPMSLAKDENVNNVEIMFATDANESNSNDQILEMHKAGKSNMAIARELGLGIGEVKLVIDLFEGGM
ncbi:MAG: hypothetical protein KIG50_01210 [Lachnospiraceae bacterium]|nr:hypothetical protein [Lachnospiraceae bacterium]